MIFSNINYVFLRELTDKKTHCFYRTENCKKRKEKKKNGVTEGGLMIDWFYSTSKLMIN